MSEATQSESSEIADDELLEEFLLHAEVQSLPRQRKTYRSDHEYFIDWLDCELRTSAVSNSKAFSPTSGTTGQRATGPPG